MIFETALVASLRMSEAITGSIGMLVKRFKVGIFFYKFFWENSKDFSFLVLFFFGFFGIEPSYGETGGF